MLLPTMTWAEVLSLASPRFIDVRSPGEFAEDAAPDALSIPLFDDDQRAMVGILYKHEGPAQALERAGELVRTRILKLARQALDFAGLSPLPDETVAQTYERLLAGFKPGNGLQLEPQPYDPAGYEAERAAARAPLFVYCWRGGMRSRAFTLFLRALGLPAVQLLDGYKGYRRQILAELDRFQAEPLILLDGMTGTGKTDILRRIAEEHPDCVLDLEGIAGHRSSILGDVGLEQASNKAFRSGLARWARERGEAPFVIVEAESRKVGDAHIPDAVWAAMKAGTPIKVEVPPELRARQLVAEYVRPERRPEIRERLDFLAGRLPKRLAASMLEAFESGDDQSVALILLQHYYDPRYLHGCKGREYAAHFDASNPAAAAEAILAWAEARVSKAR